MPICIEAHRTCDFSGGGGGSEPPIPPLDPHLAKDSSYFYIRTGSTLIRLN